jgi:hypothetical protein
MSVGEVRPSAESRRARRGFIMRTLPNDSRLLVNPDPCQSIPVSAPRRPVPEARDQAAQHQSHPQNLHKEHSKAFGWWDANPAVGSPAAFPLHARKRRTSITLQVCYGRIQFPESRERRYGTALSRVILWRTRPGLVNYFSAQSGRRCVTSRETAERFDPLRVRQRRTELIPFGCPVARTERNKFRSTFANRTLTSSVE